MPSLSDIDLLLLPPRPFPPLALRRLLPPWTVWMARPTAISNEGDIGCLNVIGKNKKKQIDINHTHEGIDLGNKPAGQGQGKKKSTDGK
jgi:hypothetical protein